MIAQQLRSLRAPRLPSRDPDGGQRGQAMTEFVIWCFVLLMMISGIIWFGKASDLKLQCHMASRYLAWANMHTPETDRDSSVIMNRVQQYYPFTDNEGTYTDLSPQDNFSGDDLNSGGPSDSGFNIFSLMNGMFNVASNTKGWRVGATYAPGGILNTTLPEGTHVQSQHFVSGGSWHKKQISGDLLIMGVKTGLFAWSLAVLQ